MVWRWRSMVGDLRTMWSTMRGTMGSSMRGTLGMVSCRSVAIFRLVYRRISICWGWCVSILGSRRRVVGSWTVTISWVHRMVG